MSTASSVNPLAVFVFFQPREKIKHIVEQGKGVPDEDAPHLVSETKYWCLVEKKREEADVTSLEATAESRAKVDANFLSMRQQNPVGVDTYTNATAKAILDAAMASEDASAPGVAKAGSGSFVFV